MGIDISEFEGLINLGQVRRAVELGDWKVEMHTLSSREYGDMTTRLPADMATLPDAKKLEVLQREIVVSAVEKINGKLVPIEAKQAIFGPSQLALCNLLYAEYSEMLDEQEKTLQEVKKNTSGVQKP